jgi:hypothetical protein
VQERERRIQVSSSLNDVLYGKGPEAIMAAARGIKSRQFCELWFVI